MRSKLVGFVAAICMCSAVGSLMAQPSFATDYFVKNLNQTNGSLYACPVPQGTGANHGTVVFKRGPQRMFVNIYVRHGVPNAHYNFSLVAHTTSCSSVCTEGFTTDSQGNGFATDSWTRQGIAKFFVTVAGPLAGTSDNYSTGEVPNV